MEIQSRSARCCFNRTHLISQTVRFDGCKHVVGVEILHSALLLSSSSYSGSACLLSGVTLLLGTMSEHIQLSIALCRIGFYTCLQKLCCKAPPPPRPEYDVVCIGLSGAGKTSLLSRLCNEISDGTVPTTGFSIKAVPFENVILNVKELGGAETIKKYWSRYYQGSQGVVFVLNSATSDEEMELSRSELLSAMQHPQLCTLPFLILANHQDSPAARSVSEETGDTEKILTAVPRELETSDLVLTLIFIMCFS
ncbi:ADP-ribosylation factor-like protein 15a isoform X3 [Onychostoma macrolepis]|uniref:ADP-ribosylation factor-like protein 15a isoform X3 n=1 Tax=Onychostoma macrolepis TaxID=369639 RepID=UPI0027297D98|nr:ADP-ribosylation factor-like protein 15a isoform X3 [Onychostoma macrolepis]